MTARSRSVSVLGTEVPATLERGGPRSSVAAPTTRRTEAVLRIQRNGSTAPHALSHKLSVRAVNVLKLLAPEIIGETPPGGHWTPPNALLQKITINTLATARNCGPQTLSEIIAWAQHQGVTIQPLHHAGRSPSETWLELEAKFAMGKAIAGEFVEALEKSVRRKNTRIPVAVQKALLSILRAHDD
jgi:hypothetical protein